MTKLEKLRKLKKKIKTRINLKLDLVLKYIRQGKNVVESLNGKIGEIGEAQKILNLDFFPC